MGGYLSFRKDVRVIIQGLDAAGKTSLLYHLKLGEVVTTIPTIGFNVETIEWAGIKICAWDLGGRDKIRPLYRHYYANTHGFIYIIDSNDKERFGDALHELVSMILMEDEVRDTVVMLLANKQDLPNAMTVQEVEDALRKKCPRCSQTVFVKGCSVATGEGMHEAFSEFVNQIKLRQKGIHTSGIISIPDMPAADALVKDGQFSNIYIYGTLKALLQNPFSCLRYFSAQEKLQDTSVAGEEKDELKLNRTDETASTETIKSG